MSIGEHAHTSHPNLQEHLEECENAAHAYGADYVHKHMAGCLEDDPNAVFGEEEFPIKSFKIAMIFVFFIICLSGLAPKAWGSCAKNETALSLLNCFSAGIFLAMALVHMMPEGARLY